MWILSENRSLHVLSHPHDISMQRLIQVVRTQLIADLRLIRCCSSARRGNANMRACVCAHAGECTASYLGGEASQWELFWCTWHRSPVPAAKPGEDCGPGVGGHSGARWHSSGCTRHRALPGPAPACCRHHGGLWGADLPPVNPCKKDRP